MKENTVTIKYSDEFLLSLKKNQQEFEEEAKFMMALKFYELGKLSSGKAAKLAGVDRIKFLIKIGQYKVSPFQMELDEILEEARYGK